jgi:hypothetical protein
MDKQLPHFTSNKLARDILAKYDLQQVVVMLYSDLHGVEIMAAGANAEDAQTATEVAKGLKDGLTARGSPARLLV